MRAKLTLFLSSRPVTTDIVPEHKPKIPERGMCWSTVLVKTFGVIRLEEKRDDFRHFSVASAFFEFKNDHFYTF